MLDTPSSGVDTNVKKREERHEAGAGFAIKTELVGKFSGFPKGINDRLKTLRLPLPGNKHVITISAYVSHDDQSS